MPTLYVYVTGPEGSGKTQFLKSLGDPEGYWADEAEGVEYRRFNVDDELEVTLVCATNSARFDKLMEIAQRDLLGYVIVVDSTNFESWSMARVMMANCRGYALLPTLIAANKQDLPGAYSAEQVGGWIGMDSMIRVAPCTATQPGSTRETFLQLLYGVKQEIERLDRLIAEIERLVSGQEQGDA